MGINYNIEHGDLLKTKASSVFYISFTINIAIAIYLFVNWLGTGGGFFESGFSLKILGFSMIGIYSISLWETISIGVYALWKYLSRRKYSDAFIDAVLKDIKVISEIKGEIKILNSTNQFGGALDKTLDKFEKIKTIT